MIEREYRLLRDDDEIDFSAPMNRLYPVVRERVAAKRNSNRKGLGDEAIRRAITALFQEGKSASEADGSNL